jgi:hypothetical protein
LNNTITAPTQSTGSLLKYYINYGIEYNPNLTIVSLLGSDGTNFGYSFSAAHGFVVGDQINISSQNSFFNGIQYVTSILTPTSILGSIAFTSSSNVSTGVCNDLQRWEGTSSTAWAFNGTRQYAIGGANTQNFNTTHVMGYLPINETEPKPFLTDYPVSSKKSIMANQKETLSFFLNQDNFSGTVGSYLLYCFFYRSNNTLISSTSSYYYSGTPYERIQRWDIPVGTVRYVPPSGTAYYKILISSGEANKSEERFFSIDTECSPNNNVRVMWLNSFGAFDYFNFRLDDTKNYNINRTEIRKVLPIAYNIGDRVRTVQSQKVTENHTINTNWVSEEIYAYLGQLLISPEVYIINEVSGAPYPVVLTDNTFQYKTNMRDKLFLMTLNYEMSYEIETQGQ